MSISFFTVIRFLSLDFLLIQIIFDRYFILIFLQFTDLTTENKNRKKGSPTSNLYVYLYAFKKRRRKKGYTLPNCNISKIHCTWFKREGGKRKIKKAIYMYIISSQRGYIRINPGRDVGSWFYLLKLVGYEPGYVSVQLLTRNMKYSVVNRFFFFFLFFFFFFFFFLEMHRKILWGEERENGRNSMHESN